MVVSKYNTQITLELLQTKRENQYFERKGFGEKDTSPTKIANELIGMLNADGGVLAFGVSNNGEIQDLNILGEKVSDYRNLYVDFIEPHGNIKLEEVDIDGKLIFLYHVDQDIERIFKRKDNEQIFLRVDDRNKQLGRDAVRNLEYDKQIRKFEDEIEPEFDFNDLDIKLLNGYKQKLNYQGDTLDLLEKRHLALKKDGVFRIKKACVLLFAKDPEKYITSASLRYIRYEGTDAKVGTEHNVVKDERFENNIPWIINQVKKFLKTTLKDFYFLDIESGRFNKVPEYPEEAWLEGVVNALCHRSYNVQGNAIYVKHYDDRLEISNSGPLPAQVNVENIRTERFSRNPRIARALEDMGFVRQLNEGVSRIYLSMEKSMLSTPEYVEKNGNVYLTLRNKISNHSKAISDTILKMVQENWANYNDTQKRILQHLFYHNQVTINELVKVTGIHEKNVRLYLNHFMDNEKILVRLSAKQRDKNAKYAFKKL
ncbi:MAG: putative DNA binding domain-containing protein [Saprospiraceae bacterium]|jgi:ATP-dependent DNA helicase RecG|nr:putative DNA binding domain-containing protein [Saprospiraceae bacterium]MCO5278287.1 putative DNA binding domain-containing protein [Saprospiraceae bacterium]